MTNRTTNISLRQAAIVAGVGLLLITILTPFADFSIRQNLMVPGDAATTAQNIMADELLFRIAICDFLIVAILDVVIAWALYVFLKPVNQSLSLLMAWFRVVYAAMLAIVLLNFVIALQLLSGADYLAVFETDQVQAQMMVFLEAFDYGWNIGLVIFGLHLLLLGYLVYTSGYIPKILGVLLIIAGFGYPIDSFGKLLSPTYEANIALFTFIGEVLLIVWLFVKGAKIPDQSKSNTPGITRSMYLNSR